MIEIKSVSCIRGEKQILNDINFSAYPGEILGIIGPNGAGKSTLLNIISGSNKDFTGSVILENKPLEEYSSRQLALKRAVVSQKVNFHLPMTPVEITLMGRHPHNLKDKTKDYEIVEKSLELTECKEFITRNYLRLSGGEQQRVQIARSLAQVAFENDNGKRMLMLDEPTSSLDIGKAFKLMNILKSVVNSNLGIIWIVHDINLAIRFTDKLLLLKEGKVFKYGETSAIIDEATISELYGIKFNKLWDEKTQSFTFIPMH